MFLQFSYNFIIVLITKISSYSKSYLINIGFKIREFGENKLIVEGVPIYMKNDDELSVIKDIIDAAPTDGLWDDSRNDENQLGLSYKQLEEAMENKNSQYYKKYEEIRGPNLHKMKPIPVCELPRD